MFNYIPYGKLYLCGTPIGNLEDMTFRAVRILQEVDFIACEDTRQTIKLLNHFKIKNKLISYHKHNEEKCSEYILENLIKGKNIALVSDAGTPVISDPGLLVIQKCLKEKIDLVPLPGPSAFLLSLIVSGFDISNFSYYGFLPNKDKDQKIIWSKIKASENISVIYESPHRLLNTIENIKTNLGNVDICICREITKKYEEFFRGTTSECLEHFSSKEIRGEFCIVIDKIIIIENLDEVLDKINSEIEILLKNQTSTKEISKIVSKKFNVSSKEIYQKIIHRSND